MRSRLWCVGYVEDLRTLRLGWDEDGHGLTMAREKARVRHAFWLNCRDFLPGWRLRRFWSQPVSAPSINTHVRVAPVGALDYFVLSVRVRFRPYCGSSVFIDDAGVLATAIRLGCGSSPSRNRPILVRGRTPVHAGESRRIGRGRPRSSGPYRADCRIFATHARYPPRQSDDTYELDEWP
jgi:hypothetical protein